MSQCGQRASFNRDRDLADEPHWCSSVFGCRNAGGVAIRSTSDDNVNDLFLRVSVLRHATPGRQRGDHLLHRLAVRERTACDAGTDFNWRIFSFHFSRFAGSPFHPSRFILHPYLRILRRKQSTGNVILFQITIRRRTDSP